MATLVLVRHGQSEWNLKDLWTGWVDIGLTDTGREEARKAGEHIKDLHFDYAYSSDLKRAKETLAIILQTIGQTTIPTIIDPAIKERNYGDFAGKNKFDLQKEWGNEEFQKIRRGWDYPVPNGETLKDVYNRAIPYFEKEILPKLKEGKNVIVASSGNALRAIVKYLEHVSETDIPTLEIALGELYIYTLTNEGTVADKRIRKV